MKKLLLSLMSFGEAKIHELEIIARMNKLEPRSTARPIYIPSLFPPSLALKLENTSEAPAPNASRVTPASDSESLNVLDIYWRAGLKCSSATNER